MAESSAAPWMLTSDATDVAACSGKTRFGMTPGVWDDPDLAALVAPPVVVTAYKAPTGRHRAMLVMQVSAVERESLPTWRDLAGALAPA